MSVPPWSWVTHNHIGNVLEGTTRMNFLQRLHRHLFGPADKDAFAQLMILALAKAGRAGPFTYEREAFLIRDGGESNTINLHNAYRDYCRSPRRGRTDVIRIYAALPKEDALELSYAEVRSRLLPRVQSRSYFHLVELQIQLQGAKTLDPFPHEPFAEAFGLGLVVDHDNAIAAVSRAQLRDWKVSFEDALAVAKENLWRQSNADFVAARPGLYVSPWQDTYDPSRLYLHDLIWQLKVSGNHVAVAPNRKALLVTGEADADGLVALAALAEQMMEDDRVVSGVALRLDGARWAPWLPPADHPAYAAFRQLAVRTQATDYADQKDLLDKLHDKRQEDVFVAKLTVRQNTETGKLTSYATWVDGVTDGLLPEADQVVLYRANDDEAVEGRSAIVPWGPLREAVGDLLERTEHYPPRYRFRSFPTGEMLDRLGVREELEDADD